MKSTIHSISLLLTFILLSLAVHGQNWQDLRKKVPFNRNEVRNFGLDVTILDSTAAIGSLDGGVFIYHLTSSGNWVAKQNLVPNMISDIFNCGSTLAMTDSLLAFRVSKKDSTSRFSQNFVSIYKLQVDTTWKEVQLIKASDSDPVSYFGISIDIYENTLVVGDNFSKFYLNRGSVYIFNPDDKGVWHETQIIERNDNRGSFWSGFGSSVALTRDFLVVGDPSGGDDVSTVSGTEDSGYVYVYKRVADSFQFSQKLQGKEVDLHDQFGSSIAINNDLMVIGSPADNEDPYTGLQDQAYGSCYLYKLENNLWKQTRKIAPKDADAHGWYGTSVALDDSIMLVGSPTGTIRRDGQTYHGIVHAYNLNYLDSFTIIYTIGNRGRNNFGKAADIHQGNIVIGANLDVTNVFLADSISSAGAAYFNGKCKESFSEIFVNGCSPYLTRNEILISDSGLFYDYLINSLGCDSIITIHSSIQPLDTTMTVRDSILYANELGANYAWYSCDNLNSILDSSRTFYPENTGYYKLKIKKDDCTYESACVFISIADTIAENDACKTPIVFPNPTASELNIRYTTKNSKYTYSLYNMLGEQIWQPANAEGLTEVKQNISEAASLYLLRITTDGCEDKTIKVIKY